MRTHRCIQQCPHDEIEATFDDDYFPSDDDGSPAEDVPLTDASPQDTLLSVPIHDEDFAAADFASDGFVPDDVLLSVAADPVNEALMNGTDAANQLIADVGPADEPVDEPLVADEALEGHADEALGHHVRTAKVRLVVLRSVLRPK